MPLSCSTTHWKQVLFMMDEPVAVHAGDVVTGAVVLQRNPVWRRHMSVALSWSVTSTQDPTSQKVRRAAGKSCCRTAGSQGVVVTLVRPYAMHVCIIFNIGEKKIQLPFIF